LLRQVFHARRIGEVDGFLMAFDQGAAYDSPNYLWFRQRYRRFVYVDRVVVAPAARGRGYAGLLYADLFDRAGRTGHDIVVCEVNRDPPNPASDASTLAGLYRSGPGHDPSRQQDGPLSRRYLARAIDR
jgi:predicted GNAT superfamily acetyltransferase